MKRTFTILMAILMACLTLTGCGKDTGAPLSGQVTPPATQSTLPTGAVQEITEAPAQEVTEAPVQERSIRLGRMEGGVYTNEYIGIGCTLDSDWSFYSAEELQEIPSTVLEALDGSELAEYMADAQQLTDMMAENVNNLTSMNILYTKLSMQERIAYATMDDEATVDTVLDQRDLLTASYAQAGIDVSSIEKTKVTFLGETRTAIHTSAAIDGIPYYVLQVFDYGLGQYGVTFSFSSYVEDKTDSMLELFYKLD